MTDDILLPTRLRRLRAKPALQSLVRETELNTNDFVYPIFIKENCDEKIAIDSMPGVVQLGLKHLKEEIQSLKALKVKAVILFGIPNEKDELGKVALKSDGIIQKAIAEIKAIDDSILVISDLCFCEYTSHGHCGVLKDNEVDNDKTLSMLGLQALSHAEAGADVIAPSGMMDGMVGYLRHILDDHLYHHLPILSYAAKYCSAFYGPFRDAAEGSPQFGDRSQYQMDVANSKEALREVALDIDEGADMLMVKPAMNYLDVIYQIKSQFSHVPLSAYQVSGEYALIKHGAKLGLIDETRAMVESLTAIKRAGADFIISYFAKDINRYLLEK